MTLKATRLFIGLGAAALMLGYSGAAMAQIVGPPIQVTAGNLISALNNINVQLDRLNALNDLTVGDIRVVNVSDVVRGNNVQALNNALNRNNVEIDILRNSLNNNEVIKNALNNNDVAVTDVVGINVLSGGDVVIFHQ